MATRVIDAILRMKDDGFTKTFKDSINLMTKYGREGNKVRKTIAAQGKAMTDIGKAMTTAVTVPMVAMATTSTKKFGEVDKTLRLVRATMGEAKWAAADLTAVMKDAASNSVFTMQESADAVLNFARQGFDARESADMLTPALDLAAGTATDLSTLTSGLGNALKMFGADSSEAAKYADVLARAQASANTTTTDLFEGLTAAGTMFNTVKWDLGDAATAIGIFGDAGLGASEGMTAMRTGLMRIASPAKAGAAALKRYGIEAFDAEGKLKDFTEVQSLLHDAFEQMGSDQERLAAASDIFGKNQANNWLTIIGAAPDRVRALNGEIEAGAGSAKKLGEALMEGLGGSIEKLKSTFDVFQYTVGETLSGTIQPFIDRLTGLLDAFNHLQPAEQQHIVKMGAIAAATGPVLMVVGKLVTGFSWLLGKMALIGKAGGSVKAALGAIGGGPVVAIIVGVAAAVAAVASHFDTLKATMAANGWVFEGLMKNFAGFKERISPVVAGLGEFGKAVWDAFGETLATAVGGAITIFGGFLSAVLGMVNGVIDGIGRMVNAIQTGFEAIKNSPIGQAASAISGFVGNAIRAGGAHQGRGVGRNAAGTSNWRGGLTMVHEKGGEIMDLPAGTRIYPHERSENMMRTAGVTISIPKLADQIVIREDADIDRLGDAIVRKVALASGNMGGGLVGSMA